MSSTLVHVSDDAMRTIQSLQAKLRRASQQVTASKQNLRSFEAQKQALLRAQKQQMSKQQETAARLQRAFSEREQEPGAEDQKYTEQLLMELKSYQPLICRTGRQYKEPYSRSELSAAEEREAQFPVDPETHAVVCRQLEAARSELRAEEAANDALAAELGEAKAASARRDTRLPSWR
eukprot:s1211_g2.t1